MVTGYFATCAAFWERVTTLHAASLEYGDDDPGSPFPGVTDDEWNALAAYPYGTCDDVTTERMQAYMDLMLLYPRRLLVYDDDPLWNARFTTTQDQLGQLAEQVKEERNNADSTT